MLWFHSLLYGLDCIWICPSPCGEIWWLGWSSMSAQCFQSVGPFFVLISICPLDHHSPSAWGREEHRGGSNVRDGGIGDSSLSVAAADEGRLCPFVYLAPIKATSCLYSFGSSCAPPFVHGDVSFPPSVMSLFRIWGVLWIIRFLILNLNLIDYDRRWRTLSCSCLVLNNMGS